MRVQIPSDEETTVMMMMAIMLPMQPTRLLQSKMSAL
jgi:hypothetical protein